MNSSLSRRLGNRGLLGTLGITLSQERIDAFTFSNNVASSEATTNLGEISANLSANHNFNAGRDTLSYGGGLVFSSGGDTVTLTNGETFTPNDGATAELSISWARKLRNEDDIRVSLIAGELGNDQREDVSLSAYWDRDF